MTVAFGQRWNLEAFFPGGSRSTELARHVEELARAVVPLAERVSALPDPDGAAAVDRWVETVSELQDLMDRLQQANAFLSCLTAQDVSDTRAKLWKARLSQLAARFMIVQIRARHKMQAVPDPVWRRLLSDPRLAPVAFGLDETRTRAAEMLPPEQETLATKLAVDGYNGWSRLYDILVGRMTIPFSDHGKTEQLSVGQAQNRFAHPEPAVRRGLFLAWEQAWAAEAEPIAAILNNLAGFRLNLYGQRGWTSVLHEPLRINRMTEPTMAAMWHAVNSARTALAAFLRRRAQLLGADQVHWYDDMAALDPSSRSIAYEEAADFIISQLGKFDSAMAAFAEAAFREAWIEAEDRPGKQPGGFCTSFPLSRESRIFLTYGDNVRSLATIAHELGHAYHYRVMADLPPLVRRYPMNLAETASTFAELLTARAVVAEASTPNEKIALLDDSIRKTIGFLMNIQCRFLFETRFYERREQGPLAVDELNDLMVAAQQEAYAGALDTHHPYFWAAKQHFYSTGVPFYNFPYTFGYLFSAGLFARMLADGNGFAGRYVALLRDTGRMTAEDLARRHLGVDLTRPEFWQGALQVLLADVAEFMALTAPDR